MCKSLMVISIAVLSLFTTSTVFAATWSIPTNVKIVQKTPATGVFTSIVTAMNSITNASATNPYLVKVMPGEYLGAVTMKPYVTLEGSGPESTVISASVRDISGNCGAGTLTMADNSSVKNITVKNTSTTGDTNDSVYGITIQSGAATADAVTVNVSGNGLYNVGICTGGTTGSFVLNNSHLEATTYSNSNGRSNAVNNGSVATLTINNSKLVASGNGNVENDVMNCGGAGKAVISNSVIESNGSVYAYLIDGFDCDVYVNNSKIIANGNPTSFCALNVGMHEDGTPRAMKVASSLIQGGNGFLCATGGNVTGADAKIVNSHDESYNAITNQ